MANIYGATLATGGTVEDIEEWPDRIRAVTADQVKAVAAKYLDAGPFGHRLSAAAATGPELRSDRASMKQAFDETACAGHRHRRLVRRFPDAAGRHAGARRGDDPGGEVATSGVTAWLVEDYSVPIVSLRFAFEGGSTQDPAGKEGLANLMTGLFDEGAGDLDSDAFQNRLDDAGAEMRFGAGRDTIYGSMRMLADEKDEALELLRLADREAALRPAAPIDRIRSADRRRHRRRRARSGNGGAGRMGRGALRRPSLCAAGRGHAKQSLAAITADDLQALHKALFARDNLHRRRWSARSTPRR